MAKKSANNLFRKFTCAVVCCAINLQFCEVGSSQFEFNCPNISANDPFQCTHRLVGEFVLPGVGETLGRKVDVDGDIAFVAAGGGTNAHLIDANANGGNIILASLTGPNLAYSVSISGNRAAGGAPDGDYVQIIEINRSTPNNLIQGTIDVQDPTDFAIEFDNFDQGFGHDVGISKNILVVGEPGETPQVSDLSSGAIHIFDANTGNHRSTVPNPDTLNASESSFQDAFGSYVAVEETTSRSTMGPEPTALIAVSAHLDDANGIDSGRVYLYRINPFDSLEPELLDVFPRPGDESMILGTISNPASTLAGIQFGQDSDINRDRLIVSYNGGAIMYDVSSAGLTSGIPVLRTFDHPIDSNNTILSQSVSLSKDFVAIGAPRRLIDPNAEPYEGGFVFLFDANNAGLVQTITDPTAAVPFENSFENFPSAVAVDNGNLVIGSFYDSNFSTAFYVGEVFLLRNE